MTRYLRPLTVGLLAAASVAACSGSSSGNDAFGAQNACEDALRHRVQAASGATGFSFGDENRDGSTPVFHVTGAVAWRAGLGNEVQRRWTCTATKDGAVFHVTVRFAD